MPLPLQSFDNHGDDLRALVIELRRGLVSYHLRKAAVQKLQEDLQQAEVAQAGSRSPGLLRVSAANPDVTEVEVIWDTDIIGRLRLSKEGLISRCVIRGKFGRIKNAENALMGGNRHISNLLPKAISVLDLVSVKRKADE